MRILKLLSNTGFISCNKSIARLLGLIEAVILGELCSISEMFGGDEFYFSQEKISNDTTLSEYQICNALKHLKEAGVINITKKGLPCRNYYSINEDRVVELLDSDRTSSQKIREQAPENFESSYPKNSGTFNNKNTEIRIQNKNTPHAEAENSETEKLNLGELQKQLFSILEVHNRDAPQERKIPVSNSLWSFVQKESRELLDNCKNESPQVILQSLKNYLLVAESPGTWKKVFSWKDFLKNFIEYTPDFFSEKKFLKTAEISQYSETSSAHTDSAKVDEDKRHRLEAELLDKFDNMVGVRIGFAEKIFKLYQENNLPCRDYREFRIQFASVSDKTEIISSKALYERFVDYAERVRQGMAEPMTFKDAIDSGTVKLEE